MDNGIDCKHNVGAFVYYRGGIARANSESGLAGRIRGLYHTGTAGSKNDIRIFHNLVGKLKGGYVDPSYDIFGRAGLYGRLGLMIIPLRVLREISVLKIAVDVGLVVGITAATSPIGSAIF